MDSRAQSLGSVGWRGRVGPTQLEAHDAITVAGGVVTTCRSLDDVAAFLVTLGVPSRTTAP